ncbi:MAG: ATP-binding protein, partial [Bacilli bacterium]|nr:ATP-binding protein [Bacilli bacterium]
LCLILRTDVLTGSQKTREIETMNAVLDAQQKQFEDSKQSIALINAKVHDIKHRIDDFGDKVAADTLDQLKSSIEIYDRPFNTGSQVLDTILYSKSLECEAAGIKLTVIGNGAPLHFIPSSKRFYLFSNIIDNAIEATHDIKNEEKKIVGLALRQEGDNFLIEEYNYFEGERKIQGQDYQTTKRDTKQKHGLGIKSIRAFAEEYGGKVEISIKRDMFFITVTIPLKEKGPKALMDHAK